MDGCRPFVGFRPRRSSSYASWRTTTIAAALTKAVNRARDAGLELNRPDLVRAPRGYTVDHPRIDLLRRRRFVVSRRHELAQWLHEPAAGTRVHAELKAAAPLVRWLREHVGATRHAGAR